MGSKKVAVPAKVTPGQRVALVAPAGPLLEADDLHRSAELCRALGLDPRVGPHAANRYGYLAGTDAERLADLNAALRDPDVDLVWCIRGGYGVTRILAGVDFEALAHRPKPILGYSDITALLNGALARAGVVSFHGPVARKPLTAFSRRHLERVLGHPAPAGRLELLPLPTGVAEPDAARIVPVVGGVAEGRLVGGNLSLLQCLVGTRWLPSLDGAILFLEDVHEDLYRIDRMLSHLALAGVLRGVAGVAIGRFTEMRAHHTDGALGLGDVLRDHLAPLGVPVASGLPIGHVEDIWTVPLGVRARFDADAGTLELLEPAVR